MFVDRQYRINHKTGISENKFPMSVDWFPDNLDEPARSCWEAAVYRNIHLHEELKSILVRTASTYYLVNLRGDKYIDLDYLTELIGPVKLIAREKLGEMNLEKGRINPFTISSYTAERVQQIICRSVFEVTYMYTNDDTLKGTIRFKSRDLIHLLDPPIIPIQPISCD